MAKNLIEETIKSKVKDEKSNLAKFIRRFYKNADPEELEEIGAEELHAKAKDMFDFLAKKKPGEPKIELTNPDTPDLERPSSILKIINKDMPFLVDSVTAELSRYGIRIHQIFHPILSIERDKNGKFEAFDSNGQDESVIYLQIAHIRTGEPSKELVDSLTKILKSVYIAVEDWQKMLTKAREATTSVKSALSTFDAEEVNESEDFLVWLAQNHFTFLGYVEYDIDKKGSLKISNASRLGILRKDSADETKIFDKEVKSFANSKDIVEITKSENKAIVHRNVYMDQIGVKKFDSKGNVIGERWFTGLFASSAYYQTTDQIPLIRRKVRNVLNKAGFLPGGHSNKIAQFVLDSYPRDEIFQSPVSVLYKNTMSIIELIKRPRLGLYMRKDRFERFITCLIFVPREKFDTDLRKKIQAILEEELNCKVTEYYTQITDSPLSRLYLIVKPESGKFPKYDHARLKRKLKDAADKWSDVLMSTLFGEYGENKGDRLYSRYENAFSDSYVAVYGSTNALYDINKIEQCLSSKEIEVELYQEDDHVGTKNLKLKTFNPGKQLALSEILPILENLGLRVIEERPFTIRPHGKKNAVWLREFKLESANGQNVNIDTVKDVFEQALKKVINGDLENDSLNRLVLFCQMQWRDIVLLRCYTKYIKQIGINLGVAFVREALAKHHTISCLLVDLFYAYFNPSQPKRARSPEAIIKDIQNHLNNVDNLSEDTILRRFADTIQATLRSNFFQKADNDKCGGWKNYLSIKLDSKKVPDLPLPRPHVEVFVYSPDVEGVHLRGGAVARGGLRWSDRHEDFRTEVLGLMKAQMVKNAVIVPVGSKGGFVVKKQMPADRDERQKLGIECYKTFLRGILDITDNYKNKKIVHPKDVVRRDDDDPYLVVAADKGTATFSDTANGISADYDFWLGDAFASGGSVGYDHKAMGITAKGAWVSVSRHFREMGIDDQKDDFTVAGIGDMSGDVFGNGMLLSKHIKLVAAFNHMHIFIDPNPNPAESFKERSRLFKLARSGWPDYNKSKISKGGGIFDRSAKSIKISKEAKTALGISGKSDSFSPDDLIKAILKAPTHLLWNGGIGTYVKAADETNRDVGDKGNDTLRINGSELRCKVIGEGGNLGFTQLGRIEYAKKGGRVNTDAIDNSAGVDCSDHEVNIKIALQNAVKNKELSFNARNKLLDSMEDEVADLVLRDNVLQTQAISIAENQAPKLLEAQKALIRKLENEGRLNREVEFLPSDKEIDERIIGKKGLTRPELSVLLSYSKLWLYDEILSSSVPGEEYFEQDLNLYFPEKMRKKYAKYIESHQLKKEIIATSITNSVINRTNSTFFYSVLKDSGMEVCDIARAYTVARDLFDLRDLWKEIEAQNGKIEFAIQAELFRRVSKFIELMTFWFLRNLPQPLKVAKVIEEYKKGVAAFEAALPGIFSRSFMKAYENDIKYFSENKVPKELAVKIADLDAMTSACDVSIITAKSKLSAHLVSAVYFEVGASLSLGWLRYETDNITAENYWERLALRNVTDSLYEQQRRLTAEVIRTVKKGKNYKEIVSNWQEQNKEEQERHRRMVKEFKSAEKLSIPMLVSAVKRIETLCAK